MKQEEQPEEDPNEDNAVMMLILFEINRAKQNQKEFIKAIDDFFDSI